MADLFDNEMADPEALTTFHRGSDEVEVETEFDAEASKEALMRLYNWLLGRKDMEIDGRHIFDILLEEYKVGRFVNADQVEKRILTLLHQTEYFKNNEEGRFDRDKEWYEEGSHEEWSTRRRDLVNDVELMIREELQNLGLDWSESQILETAKVAWQQGIIKADEIRRFISTETIIDFGPDVEPGTTQNELRKKITGIYDNYFTPPEESSVEEWSRRAYLSEDPDEQLDLLRDLLGDQAADLYPGSAERIKAGRSPLEILGSYNSIFASIMGYYPKWATDHRDLAVQVLTNELGPKQFGLTVRTSDEADHNPKIVNETFSDIKKFGVMMGAMP